MKPAGLVVHPSKIKNQKANNEKTLVDWILARHPEVQNVGDDPQTRPGIVHRLDKDTSGVMLVARTQSGFEYLKALFKKYEIQKTYLAVVEGKVKSRQGVIHLPIGMKSGTTRRTTFSKRMAKEAITEYRVLRYGTHRGSIVTVLEVTPKTGRTHQIRVHLASIGHPVVGDTLYGRKSDVRGPKSEIRRLMLHALALEFTAAEGRRIRVEAEPPEEFTK